MRISQFYITLGVLPFHLSLSISINATLNRNSNFLKKKTQDKYFFWKLSAFFSSKLNNFTLTFRPLQPPFPRPSCVWPRCRPCPWTCPGDRQVLGRPPPRTWCPWTWRVQRWTLFQPSLAQRRGWPPDHWSESFVSGQTWDCQQIGVRERHDQAVG